MQADTPPPDTSAVLEFMFRLGQAYLACGEQTAQVELSLRRVASAYGMRRSRVVVFPTAIFISLHDREGERVTLAEGPTATLRLDQIADVYELGDSAQDGAIAPQDGIRALAGIQKKPARFGVTGLVIGHAILSVGLSLILSPSRSNVVAVAILGAFVGALKAFNRGRPILAAPLYVIAALLVSLIVYTSIKYGLALDPFHVLVPPLVSFLPGAMLTFGMVELAFGDMVSGSSRLITGCVQVVLLAFGLAAGAVLAGYSPESLVAAADETADAIWAAWAGVLVFGIGVYVHFSAPRNSLGWLLLVLVVAFAAQRIGTALLGHESVSGFFGMLVATPLGYLIQKRFRGPPAMVTFLPSFWLLVPGALSLLSVKRILTSPAEGIESVMGAVFAVSSIALGTLMGASLYKWITERFGWWQLQIGRVGSYFRRNKQ